jgi:hypothetical protein
VAAPVRGREAAADLRAEGDCGGGRGRRCGCGDEVSTGGATGGNGARVVGACGGVEGVEVWA